MLNKDGIYDVHGFIQFKSKVSLVDKPSYFSVGGFSIPVDIGEGEDYLFDFDFIEQSGYSKIDEDGRVVVNISLRDLDWEFIEDSLECSQNLELYQVFNSMQSVEMDEIYYIWDKQNQDRAIYPDQGHFFDVTYFQIDIYSIVDDEEKVKQIVVPQDLLSSYNEKTDAFWKGYLQTKYC